MSLDSTISVSMGDELTAEARKMAMQKTNTKVRKENFRLELPSHLNSIPNLSYPFRLLNFSIHRAFFLYFHSSFRRNDFKFINGTILDVDGHFLYPRRLATIESLAGHR